MTLERSTDGAGVGGTLRRRERVLAATQGDTTVLMDAASGRYFTLNDVAGRIWTLLETPRSLPELISVLADEYEVERDRLVPDVVALTGRLSELSLVVSES
jgi:hypothetical protein